jgi:hypothetical protein
MPRFALVATWMLLAQGWAATTPAENYVVKFDRPAVVGEQYVVAGWTRSVKMVSLTGGQQPKHDEESSRVRFALGVKVLEVGPSRQVRRAVLTVQRLTREAQGATDELLAAGTSIDARLDGGKPVFEVGGRSVEGDAEPALTAAANLHADDRPTDDEVMGSRQRRGIGESWPINAGAAMRVFDKNAVAAPQGVVGSVTLAAKRRVGDIPCLEYRFKLEIPRMPDMKEPPGFENTLRAMTTGGSILAPLDPSLPVMEESFTLEVHSRSQGTANGVAATLELRGREELHLERAAPAAVQVH